LFTWNVVSKRDWFAVSTIPRHEKRVEEHLLLREIECFLPSYQKFRQWNDGTKRLIRFPLFPGYIFVQICRSERVSVRRIPGVVSIVGNTREPLPVPDAYIQFLQESLRLGKKIEPHPYLNAGERVRIRQGLMAGAEGVLLRKKDSVSRVVLTLETIMRSVVIEVPMEDIEPLRPEPTCMLSLAAERYAAK
jgi:transcription antitermination factor NusG